MVQLANASHTMPVEDRCETSPWSPDPIFKTLERAFDPHDLSWCEARCDTGALRKLRRCRRHVVSLCVTELRRHATLAMDDWRTRAAAKADYSGPDPFLQMMAIQALLLAVDALAVWVFTLGLPHPAATNAALARLRESLQPLSLAPV